MPGFVSPKGERTYRRIVDATVRVIAVEGVRAVTHRRVAKEAKSSVGLVTYYFSTTEALIAATLEEIAAVETAAHDRLRESVLALGEDLGGIVDVLVAEVAERRGPRRTTTLASIALTLELSDQRQDRSPFGAWEGSQLNLFEAVIRALGGEPDEALLTYLAASLDGLFLYAVIAPDAAVIERAARDGLTRVLQGVRATRGPGAGVLP